MFKPFTKNCPMCEVHDDFISDVCERNKTQPLHVGLFDPLLLQEMFADISDNTGGSVRLYVIKAKDHGSYILYAQTSDNHKIALAGISDKEYDKYEP